jgi:hypothetical protein
MIGWHSHYDRLTPMRAVPKLDEPSATLKRAAVIELQ